MDNLAQVVENSFYTYAGMVIADRAIVDVRDCLKPSPRVLLYNQYRAKNFYNKPFVKSASLVGDALKTFYYHGDTACYEMYCRMAAPYAMRYPLNLFHGNYGTLEEGRPAAMRYTEMKLSDLATNCLFEGLDKKAISVWRDNFDETDKSPTCFPSIGYYNICNGAVGLAIGVSSSIPQFNLVEVNKALIKLIRNENVSFDEIYCAPDFATGGTIINAAEVKESLKNGQGKACHIRATIEYDSNKNELIVTELPYGVYSKTIVKQVQEKIQENPDYGISRIYDNSADKAEIVFELEKNVSPTIMINKLYKDTSLEYWFNINMVMLKKGRFPQVFSWKEACESYIEHIRECKINELKYELEVLLKKQHILQGLYKAIANIDDIISIIRNSDSSSSAKIELIKKFDFTKEQVDAILEIKLSKLAKLESIAIEKDLENNINQVEKINEIINSKEKLDNLLIEKLEYVIKKYGDSRRTKIIDLSLEKEEIDIIPLYYKIIGDKIKLSNKNESKAKVTTNVNDLFGVTTDGKIKKANMSTLLSQMSLENFFGTKVVAVFDEDAFYNSKYLIIATKKGYIKKISINNYNKTKRSSFKITKILDEDKIVGATLITNDIDISFSLSGRDLLEINTSMIKEVSKVALGEKKVKDKEILKLLE